MTRNASFVWMIILLPAGYVTGQNCERVSQMPTLCITTEVHRDDITKATYVTGSLKILGDHPPEHLYDGGIRIRGRGNSTWRFAKKPYRINLNNATSLFGLPATGKNWALLANHADKTLIRNALAFEISKYLSMPYTVSYQFVDVVFNQDYLGTYMLTDHVEARPGRVDIEEPGDEDNPGGFLIEIDGFAESEDLYFQTARQNKFTFKYPDVEDNSSPHIQPTTDYLNDFENKLHNSLNNPNEYKEKIDFESAVNWYLASELCGNSDAFWTIYLHKRRSEDKMHFGPLWDFDIAFDNDSRIPNAPYRLMADVGQYFSYQDWMLWFRKDDAFMTALKDRWIELRNNGFREFVLDKIEELADYLKESGSVDKNYEVWAVLNEAVHYEVFLSPSYDDHVQFLYEYMIHRFDWLDKELLGLPTHIYYNVRNEQSHKSVSFAIDDRVVQKSFENENRFKWEIEALPNAFYRLKNAETHKFLSEADSGNQLIIAEDQPHDRSQQWRITEVARDRYLIISRNREKGVENRNNDHAEDNPVESFNISNNGVFQNWIAARQEARWEFVTLNSKLPIKLSKFDIHKTEMGLQLFWSVTESVNGSFIEVERMEPNGRFRPLSSIMIEGDDVGDYIWNDLSPRRGVNYYRLKLWDLDGTWNYSGIVSDMWDNHESPVRVFPNPAREKLIVSHCFDSGGTVKLEVLNLSGQLLGESRITVRPGESQLPVDTRNLPEGLFYLRLTLNNQVETVRFLKIL